MAMCTFLVFYGLVVVLLPFDSITFSSSPLSPSAAVSAAGNLRLPLQQPQPHQREDEDEAEAPLTDDDLEPVLPPRELGIQATHTRRVIPKSSVLWLSEGEPNAEKDWRRIVQISISRILPTENIVHIIQSHFISSKDVAADLAQVELFKTFALPGMQTQIKLNFIWIIQLSHDLDPLVIATMQDIVQQCQSTFLIKAANSDHHHNHHTKRSIAFRDKKLVTHLETKTNILSGDLDLLQKYIQHSNGEGEREGAGVIMLETVLPFTAGLPRQFVNYLQESVKQRFAGFASVQQQQQQQQLRLDIVNRTRTDDAIETETADADADLATPPPPPQAAPWAYWCANKQFDWYVDSKEPYGNLSGNLGAQCITSGSTIGYMIGGAAGHGNGNTKDTLATLPRTDHELSELYECETPHETECADPLREIAFGAIVVHSEVMDQHHASDHDQGLTKKQRKQKLYVNQLQWEGMFVV
jgi:hypothetical protein